MSDPWIPPEERGERSPRARSMACGGDGASLVEGGITWIGGCYPYRVYPWRAGLPAEGGVTRGGWCYPWRVVLPVEGGVTRGGWCDPWRVM